MYKLWYLRYLDSFDCLIWAMLCAKMYPFCTCTFKVFKRFQDILQYPLEHFHVVSVSKASYSHITKQHSICISSLKDLKPIIGSETTSQVTSSLSSLWDLLSELRDERARNRQQIQCLAAWIRVMHHVHRARALLTALGKIDITSYYMKYDITFILFALYQYTITLFWPCFLTSQNNKFVILQQLFQVCLFRGPISFLSSGVPKATFPYRHTTFS